ncbi:Protein membrane [Peptoniphilus sp. ING2-D1G]|nr:Protein membrane [Peptoniphilus sp. ING2-D1G]
MGNTRIKVTIDDMNFFVVGNNNSEYINSLAEELDSRIKETQHSNYRLNQVQTLILTALNVLDEKEKIKNEEKSVQRAIEDETEYRNTIRELENAKVKIEVLNKSNESLNTNINLLKSKLRSVEEDNREYRARFERQNQKISELEEKNETLKKEKDTLESQIYESQKRIIDLNRELESLNEKK